MCPICVTTTAIAAASIASGASIFGIAAVKFRILLRRRHGPSIVNQE